MRPELQLLCSVLTLIKADAFISICLVFVSISQKEFRWVTAVIYLSLHGPQIKTLSSPATEKVEKSVKNAKKKEKKNDSSRRPNSLYALEQGLRSSVTEESHLFRKRMQLRGHAGGALKEKETASQKPRVGEPASLPDSLMSVV